MWSTTETATATAISTCSVFHPAVLSTVAGVVVGVAAVVVIAVIVAVAAVAAGAAVVAVVVAGAAVVAVINNRNSYSNLDSNSICFHKAC